MAQSERLIKGANLCFTGSNCLRILSGFSFIPGKCKEWLALEVSQLDEASCSRCHRRELISLSLRGSPSRFHKLSQLSGCVIGPPRDQDENGKEELYIVPLRKKKNKERKKKENATSSKEIRLPKDETFLLTGRMCPSCFGEPHFLGAGTLYRSCR